jgi:elongation factor G
MLDRLVRPQINSAATGGLMADTLIGQVRNLGIVAHGGSGATSLGEIDRLGRVDEGTTTSDHDPEEIKHRISINLAVLPCKWREHAITVIDTPGYADFVGDTLGGLRVSDTALIVVDAVSGVQVGTSTAWKFSAEFTCANAFFINKLDRENADFFGCLDQLRKAFGEQVVPVQLPIGSQANLAGTVDLVTGKVSRTDGSQAIPSEMKEQVEQWRFRLLEAIAVTDDSLMEKYLENEDLPAADMAAGLRRAMAARQLFPVYGGSAYQNLGVRELLDGIVDCFPSPLDCSVCTSTGEALTSDPTGPMAAFVFKTVADQFVGKLSYFRVYSGTVRADSHVWNENEERDERIGQVYIPHGKRLENAPAVGPGQIGAVAKLAATVTGHTLCDRSHRLKLPAIAYPAQIMALAVEPKTKADTDKMGQALARIIEEDPTLRTVREADTHQTILSGMGEQHLNHAVEKLHRFGANVTTALPQVNYKETIRGTADVQGRHKKQTGGHGQFGDVKIKFEPLPRGSGFQFVDAIVGGAVPRQYIPSVEKGLRSAILEGVLGGFPVVDLKATLHFGSYHAVDSSDMAFQMAANLAFREGVPQAKPVLLEPIMKLDILAPEEFIGAVISDLNGKRGRVLSMDQEGTLQRIQAEVPHASMLRYAIELRSLTRGSGASSMEFDHYDEAPAPEVERVITERKQRTEEQGRH